jgi:uncharacterized membrane protein YccC
VGPSSRRSAPTSVTIGPSTYRWSGRVDPIEDRSLSFLRDQVRWEPDRIDLRRGALDAVVVVLPLVVGYLLGVAEAAVLVSVGALNLLLVEAPYPGRTPGRVLLVAAGTNAIAFGAGTVVGLLPRLLELPFVALGIFAALWGTRSARWENASFIAAVMFVFAVGVPPTTALGIALRPSAVLLGGTWAMSALSVLALFRPRPPRELFEPLPALSPVDRARSRAAARHSAAVAATATVGLVIGLALGLPRDYWVMLTVLVALRLDLASTLSYSASRTAGTVVGAAGAYAVTSLTSSPWLLFPVLVATTMLAFATRSVNYLVYAVGITLTVILLLNLVYSGGPSLAIARVIDTIIGGTLALVAAFALFGYGGARRRASRVGGS